MVYTNSIYLSYCAFLCLSYDLSNTLKQSEESVENALGNAMQQMLIKCAISRNDKAINDTDRQIEERYEAINNYRERA